jgi:hypothetical protein
MPALSPPPTPPSRWPIPRGTVTVIVGRLEDNGHTRGGRRVHVGRVPPDRLDTLLAGQPPGRFRVSCINAGGQFVRGGAYAVEIGPESTLPRIVPARTSRDYGTRTPLSAARRKERAALGRVEVLRQRLRTMERENARRLGDAARQEAEQLADRVSEAGVLRHLADEVGRLSRQLSELRAEVEGRDRELRVFINAALAQQEVQVEHRVAALAAWMMESGASSPSDLPVEQVAEVEVTTATMNTADPPPAGAETTGEPRGARPGLAGGMAALAGVRNIARDGRPLVEGTEPPTTRLDTLGQLGRFLRREPPKR